MNDNNAYQPWRPGRRDLFVAELIDFVLRLGSARFREVLGQGMRQAILDAGRAPRPVAPSPINLRLPDNGDYQTDLNASD